MITLKRKYKNFKYILILILSFLFCTAVISFLLQELTQNKVYYINNYGKEQELLVGQVSKQSEALLTEKKNSEPDVIQKIITKAETSGSRYWFFTKGNTVLFYKNSYETEKLPTKKASELISSFKRSGGYNIDELLALIDHKSDGTVILSEAKNSQKILMSIHFFKVNGNYYSIGMSTKENYILSSAKISEHNTFLIIEMIAICLIFLLAVITGLSLHKAQDEKITFLEKGIRSKDMKIKELTETVPEFNQVYNENPKMYGKDVLYAVLKKSDIPGLYPICMLFVELDYPKHVIHKDLILKLSDLMSDILPNKSIKTKFSDNLLVIVFMKTEYRHVKSYEKKLLKAATRITRAFGCSIKSDVITQSMGKDAPLDMLESRLKTIIN